MTVEKERISGSICEEIRKKRRLPGIFATQKTRGRGEEMMNVLFPLTSVNFEETRGSKKEN